MTVQYPPSYDPQKRRYSVSSESIDPLKLKDIKVKSIPKSEKVGALIKQTMKGNVLFKHLDEAELHEVIDSMDELDLPPSQTVIKQGDHLDQNHMYLIQEGELDVYYGSDIVATLTPGCSFGEIALMYGCPRTATIKTKTQCKLWVLDRNTFRRILMEESMRKRKLYESVLAKVPIFKSLLPYERSKVADALETVTFTDKQVIIQQGSTDTNKFYIIEKGEVICTKQDDLDSPSVFSLSLKAGDYFGELALLKNMPRQANVIAQGNVKCLTIDREHFTQVTGPCEEILRRNMGNYKTYEELIQALVQEKKAKTEIIKKPQTDFHVDFVDLPANRDEMVKYIIQNESEYVFNLTQLSGYKEAITQNAVSLKVSPEQVSKIFCNVTEILHLHQNFSKYLVQVENCDEPELGPLYSELAPKLNVYEVFANQYPESWKARKECSAHIEWTDFLMACHKEAGESLDTLLEHVYFRVFQIVALLEHLSELTDSLHFDKNLLAIALRKIETILHKIDK
uniref:Cyclic nucleotide-binding domain-containing protein n=1 Tax=Arcella intermedia TaxID=1963864 RepID=A0A6B2L149_9EUKA